MVYAYVHYNPINTRWTVLESFALTRRQPANGHALPHCAGLVFIAASCERLIERLVDRMVVGIKCHSRRMCSARSASLFVTGPYRWGALAADRVLRDMERHALTAATVVLIRHHGRSQIAIDRYV